MVNQKGRIDTLLSRFNNFQKVRVQELRQALVEDFGYPPEKANAITGKTELVTLYQTELKAKVQDAMLANAGGVGGLYPKVPDFVPTSDDPRWTDWILDQLDDDEKVDGYPKCDGLRRITEKIIGNIIYQDTDVLTSPNAVNGPCATVKHTIIIRNRDDETYGKTSQFCGTVDVNSATLSPPFNKHLVATAETKAESRALKRALKIRVNTAEEMIDGVSDQKPAATIGLEENHVKIQESQKTALYILAERLDINLEKFLERHVQQPDIDKLSFNEALNCCKELNNYQISKEPIPTEIVGYIKER